MQKSLKEVINNGKIFGQSTRENREACRKL